MTTYREQYEKARNVMPGGVNSSSGSTGRWERPSSPPAPRAAGSWISKAVNSSTCAAPDGAALLGHGHPAVNAALRKAIELGHLHSFETEYHEQLAEKICRCVPCAERVRFCSSGSEATLHLIRACRAYTGRTKIIRFEGHFHGYHELIYIGGHPPQSEFPRNRTRPYVESPGIPAEFADFIIPVPFNDAEAVERAIDRHAPRRLWRSSNRSISTAAASSLSRATWSWCGG